MYNTFKSKQIFFHKFNLIMGKMSETQTSIKINEVQYRYKSEIEKE